MNIDLSDFAQSAEAEKPAIKISISKEYVDVRLAGLDSAIPSKALEFFRSLRFEVNKQGLAGPQLRELNTLRLLAKPGLADSIRAQAEGNGLTVFSTEMVLDSTDK